MNRQSTLAILALALTPGSLSRAAAASPEGRVPPPAVLESAPAGTVVFDDDGGRVQIIPRRPEPSATWGEVSYHGGPVVSDGDLRAIFLGSGWRSEMRRAREPLAVEALAGRGQKAAMASLSRFGLREGELKALAQEDLLDPLAGATISDLEIQARLDALAAGGASGDAGLGAVYVVFLAPGIESTLGSSTSARDFAAYHNHFHSAAGVVRYVVVPYEDDFSRWLASARQSLVQALINPEGTSWY